MSCHNKIWIMKKFIKYFERNDLLKMTADTPSQLLLTYLLDFLWEGNWLGDLSKVRDDTFDGECNALAKVVWVQASSDNLEALGGNGASKNSGAMQCDKQLRFR